MQTFDEYIDEWIHSVFNKPDDLTVDDVKDDVNWIYKKAKLDPPSRIYLANDIVEHYWKVKGTNSIHHTINKQALDRFLDQPITAGFDDKRVYDSRFDTTKARIVDRLTATLQEKLKGSFSNVITGSTGLMHGLWVGCYGYAIKEGTLDEKKCGDLVRYFNFLNKGIFDITFTKSDAYICKCPTKTHIETVNGGLRLSSAEEPAIQWRGHNADCYFIHGIEFDKELWERIVRKTMPCKEIIALKNIEQRYVALKIFGPENMLTELDAKLIDRHEQRGIELYGIDDIIPRQTLKMLKYSDPSTGRVYVSFVPYEVINALGGMAWKFSVSPEQYDKLTIEG